MSYIHPDVLDGGLQVLTDDVDQLHFCDDEPSVFADIATMSLGSKSGPTVGAPTNATPTGRRVIVSAVVDGAATGAGDIAYWALVDAAGSRLLAAGELNDPMAVTVSDIITSEAFSVIMPGPA